MPDVCPIVEFQERVRVLDHSGALAFWAEPGQARRLLASGGFEILRTKKRVRALRAKHRGMIECARVARQVTPLRKPGAGASHKRETHDNPKGAWTIDRIPDSIGDLFRAVVTECAVIEEEQAA